MLKFTRRKCKICRKITEFEVEICKKNNNYNKYNNNKNLYHLA